jgi:predicted MFS family arabinose efflux permease
MFSPVFTFMAADFAVPVTFSGYVSGMYTSGAVLSGIIAFYWVDRCNKKRFLIANMVLLAMATLLTTFTTSFPFLHCAFSQDWLAVRQWGWGSLF